MICGAALQEFARSAAPWLTFLATTILGLTTAYYAWRTRQMQRAELRHLNRQADLELAEAEAELNYGVRVLFDWNSWKANFDVFGAVAVYARVKDNLKRPDLAKVVRILSFYIPEAEKEATQGILRLYAALEFLNLLIADHAQTRSSMTSQLDNAEHALQEADAQMRSSLEAVKRKRQELRQS